MTKRLIYPQELVRMVNLHARPETAAAMLRDAVTMGDLEEAIRSAPASTWISGLTGEQMVATARAHALPSKAS